MPSAVDERAVDQGIGAVRVAHERERQVRAVVEVDREPVPAAAPDRDEVAPLVIEPGVALDGERPIAERQRARGRHRRPRVVVRAAGDAEVDAAVSSWSAGALRGASASSSPKPSTGSPPPRPASPRPPACPRPAHPTIVHGVLPGGVAPVTSRPATGARSPSVAARVARRAVDLRPDLRPLVVVEPATGLVGHGDVRRPRDRQPAALGAEHDVLEPEPAAVLARAGGPCSTTTRSGGRAARRRAAARPAADPAGRGAAVGAGVRPGARAAGLARTGPEQAPTATVTTAARASRARGAAGVVIGSRPPPRPRSAAASAAAPGPAGAEPTSSIARAGASSRARAAPGRRSRRAPRRSRRPARAP